MRIGLLSQSIDNESGIGRIALSLAQRLHETGHEIHCLVQRVGVVNPPFDVRRVPSLPFSKGLKKLAYRMATPGALRGTTWDVIHAFGVGAFADVVSAQSCHLAGIALLKEHHLDSRPNRGLYDRVSLADERRLMTSPRTKKVIAVSHLVKNQIVEFYGVKRERVAVVPNGVDLSRFVTAGRERGVPDMRRTLGIPGDKFVLLFVGNEFGRKGLHVLIRSLGMMRDDAIHLLVIGGDDPGPYRKLAQKEGCPGQITFMGTVAGPEPLFSVADACVLPSLYEPFGMVIVEAMAAGLPVVASRHCGAVERMTDGEQGLYLSRPEDADELTAAIRRLISDDALRARLARTGREEARKFDWSMIAARILEVYKEVAHAA